ncbi:hypothetical protein Peur_004769 [Populus x canadensis]
MVMVWISTVIARFGRFSVEDAYNNRKSGVGDSRAWYDTDSGEIESVVEAARMGYGMRNKESGIRTRAACLMKRSLTRSFLCRAYGSYGWLDPTELVQFDSHYAEKSKQTNAKVFLIKAVEEEDDEIRRRAAHGLMCPCRSLYSFRPTHVDGVLQVDICGYEAGGLYTVEQIRRARAAFQSVEMLA